METRFDQRTSVHYQAISYTDHSNLKFRVLLYIKLRPLNLHKISKISKKMITDVHREQQIMGQELIQRDREERNVRSNSLTVYLTL